MRQHGAAREHWAARISRYLAWASGALLLFGCAGLITLDVILRYIFNRTVVESFELSGYAFGAAIGLGMAYTISAKSNIRIDLVSNRMPPPIRALLDMAAHLGLVLVAVTIGWYALQTWLQSAKLDAKSITILQIPLVIPQGFWLAGLLWFALFAAIVALRAAAALARRDLKTVDALIGPATLREEIEAAGAPETSK